MRSQKTKEEHYKDAAMCVNASDSALRQSESDGGVLFLLARGIFTSAPSSASSLSCVGIHQMATRSMEDALRCFDAVLSTHPTNVIALLGKVCTTQGSNVVKTSGVHVYSNRRASSTLDANTPKLSSFSKMSYGTIQNVNQIPGLVLGCAFGLWIRNPEQRRLGNGVWKWYEPIPLTTSTWAHHLSRFRTTTTLLPSFSLVWRRSIPVRTRSYLRTSVGRPS